MRNLVAAALASILLGLCAGLVIHAMPPSAARSRAGVAFRRSGTDVRVDPLLIVVFGIGPLSLIVLGTLFAMVAMVMSTLTAIDRIPHGLSKVARITRLTWLQTLIYVKLPASALQRHRRQARRGFIPNRRIAGEFIVSTAALVGGSRLPRTTSTIGLMPRKLLLLVFPLVVALNAVLHGLERRLHRRWVRRT